MTDNEKLAKFQGWKPEMYDVEDFSGNVTQEYESTPDYLNDDPAAMSLLDTLVEKGFCYYLTYTGLYKCSCIVVINNSEAIEIENKPTRRAAVVAAVLKMIGKEDV